MQQWEITSRTCGQDSEVVNGDGTITVMVTLFLLAILLKYCIYIISTFCNMHNLSVFILF